MVNARSIEAYRFVFDMARSRVHLYHSRFFDTTIYDTRISRKEFNIEKKKKNSRNFSNFHEKFRPRFPRTCETFEEKEGEEGERYTTRFVTFEREAIK